MKNLLCFVFTLCLLFAQRGFSQPKLIKDINTQTADAFSTNQEFVGNFGNYLFFKPTSGLSESRFYFDYEPDLWVTDGTTNGTVKIGSGSIIKAPYVLTQLGNKVIFYGNDAAHGSELWISDGTLSGTHLLKDIATGRGSSMTDYSYSEFVILNDKAYFIVTDDTGKLNIWRTDGTEAGTELFQNIGGNNYNNIISEIKVMGGSLYYAVSTSQPNSNSECKLWKSDGTTIGTYVIKNITSLYNNIVFSLTSTDNKLFFNTFVGSSNLQLWSTDGTTAGTIPLIVFVSDIFFRAPVLTFLDNKIIFTGYANNKDGVWSSDGTVAGTILIKNKIPNTSLSDFINYNGKVYFWGQDSDSRYKLWSSDGTSTNTKVALNSSKLQRYSTSQPYSEFVSNNLLFLVFRDGNNLTLWKTDGTDNLLEIVKDSDNNNLAISNLQNPRFFATPNRLFFTNSDSTHGKELWATDGSSANTFQLKDINQSTNNAIPYGSFRSTILNHKIFFAAQENLSGRTELWTSDGTASNTIKVKDKLPNLSREFPQFTGKLETLIDTLNNNLVFSGIDTLRGEEIWISDGTNAGTSILKDINLGLRNSKPLDPIRLGSKLFFNANDGIHGREMWVSDGSSTGTVLLKDFYLNNNSPFTDYETIRSKTIFNGKLYFIARDDLVDSNIWETDGTVTNTKKVTVRSSYSQLGTPIFGLTAHKNKLFFVGTSSTSQLSLWTSNGEIGGEQLIKDLYIYAALNGKPIVSFRDWVFTFASDNLGSSSQTGLWKSDGTTAGTTLLLNDERIDNQTFTVGNDNLFFTIQNELWKTDGTIKGTSKVTLLGSNLEYNYVKNMNFINGHLYFQVINQIKGIELWQSDGTSGGTMFVLNMSAGHYQNIFNETNKFSVDGNRFFFTGNDVQHGRELWTYNTCDNLTNVQSVQSGTWDNATTWTCGHIPKVTDIATILNGNIVEVLQDTYLKRLKLLDGNVFLNGGNLKFR
jgi:ELWxxDGT repeat protein